MTADSPQGMALETPEAPPRASRVALVVSQLRPGGAERVVAHLAQALPRLGVRSRVVCLAGLGELGEELRAAGVPVKALGSARGYDLRAVLALAGELVRFVPDVINVHDRSSLPYVVLANRLAGRRPIVFSGHGLLMRDGIRPRLRERLAAWDVQAVTAVSESAAAEYVRLLGWLGGVEVIDNGVPPIARSPAERHRVRSQLGADEATFVYLAMGNIKPEKGFEDLLAAAASLRDRTGVRKPSVWIAGGVADKGYYESLLAQQRELGLDSVVRFLGFRSDVAALYSAADAFVLSSRKEGLPMVLLEAMSAGLPVVATKVGAVPEVIAGSREGLLVSPAEPVALAEAMSRLLVDESLCARLGQAARGRVQDRFGIARMAADYLAVYRRLAEEPVTAMPRDSRSRPDVLMLGPMPPLTGGMATVLDNLRRSRLGRTCRLTLLNNGKMTPPGRRIWTGVLSQLTLLARVLRQVWRGRSQIVHIHTCALFSFWRDIGHAIAVRMLGRQVIWHVHDGTFAAFLGQGLGPKRRIIRWALRLGSAAIVLSEMSRRSLAPLAPAVRWRVVPNAVAVPDRPAIEAEGPVRFLFLGNLTRRKGAFDLVDAANAAFRQGASAEVHLAGGEVQAGDRDELARHIEGLACRDRIRLVGVLSGPAKDRALAESHCLVLPSYAEGLPMAILEGMAHGLPVIASTVGSIPDVVHDGHEGFLVEPGDVSALGDRMARLVCEPELRRQMGRAARQRVQESHSLDSATERILAVYREGLGPRLRQERG